MDISFGALKRRRQETNLTLREFVMRSSLDPGNLSRIERGRLDQPQSDEILHRFCDALGYEPDDPRAIELRDLAAIQMGRFPADLMSDPNFLREAPAMLRALRKAWSEGMSGECLLGRVCSPHGRSDLKPWESRPGTDYGEGHA